MIKYKCEFCGVKLETDDSLRGAAEPCPVCSKINMVPLSKRELAEMEKRRRAKEQEKLRRDREKRLQAGANMEGGGEHIKEPDPQTLTEIFLGLIGGLGMTMAVLVLYAWYADVGPGARPWLSGMQSVAISLILSLASLLLLTCRLILQYLRRIANAAESRARLLARQSAAPETPAPRENYRPSRPKETRRSRSPVTVFRRTVPTRNHS